MQVSSVAKEIATTVPSSVPIYFLEMPDRWIAYYLIRDEHRDVRRLHSKFIEMENQAQGIKEQENKSYLVLSETFEKWWLSKLEQKSIPFKILSTIAHGRFKYFILELDSKDLNFFEPVDIFPINPRNEKDGQE
jgi:hypothetical protein